MRPPDMTSRSAYSSATRFGYWRLIGVPATMIGRARGGGDVARRHQPDRRRHAVRHAVVLVDGEPVEAELGGAHHRAQVPLVQLVADLGVVLRVRIVDDGRPEPLVIVRDRDVVMVVEEVELDLVERGQTGPSAVGHGQRSPLGSVLSNARRSTCARIASRSSSTQPRERANSSIPANDSSHSARRRRAGELAQRVDRHPGVLVEARDAGAASRSASGRPTSRRTTLNAVKTSGSSSRTCGSSPRRSTSTITSRPSRSSLQPLSPATTARPRGRRPSSLRPGSASRTRSRRAPARERTRA